MCADIYKEEKNRCALLVSYPWFTETIKSSCEAFSEKELGWTHVRGERERAFIEPSHMHLHNSHLIENSYMSVGRKSNIAAKIISELKKRGRASITQQETLPNIGCAACSGRYVKGSSVTDKTTTWDERATVYDVSVAKLRVDLVLCTINPWEDPMMGARVVRWISDGIGAE
ncbi:hypothetical protein BGZ60DRAFT_539547 [Tricladium varicosporioides]|nr:hypothetical protein BGZ60DRAFT_539547 [Hymenoscyphus varicosporioides]